MYNWYDRGILQVIDKESGETLLEIETTIEHLQQHTKFNFELCDYQFSDLNFDYILNNEEIEKLLGEE